MAHDYYEDMIPERPSMVYQLLEAGVNELFARMLPHSPHNKQPHRTYHLAPLGTCFPPRPSFFSKKTRPA